jgi:hypothetical protein
MDSRPKIWEWRDYPDDPLKIPPQGFFNPLVVVFEPDAKGCSNAGNIKKEDILSSLTQPPASVPNRPSIDLETGTMRDANGAPPGLQFVAQKACCIAHTLKYGSLYHWGEPRCYSVQITRMGSCHVAMVLLWPGDDDRALRSIDDLDIEDHARIFQIDSPSGVNANNWDYQFLFPDKDEEATTDEESTDEDNNIGIFQFDIPSGVNANNWELGLPFLLQDEDEVATTDEEPTEEDNNPQKAQAP